MPSLRAEPSARPRLGVLPGLLVLLTPLSQLGFIPVSVVLGDRIGLSVGQVGVTVGVYAAAAALGTVLLGPLFDLLSPRRVLPVAVAANVVLSAALLLEPGFAGIVLARVLTGITNSALMLCAAVIVADAHRDDPGGRDRGFSRLQTFTSVGAASGLAVGAVAAGLGSPQLWSWVVVGYGVLVLALAPLIARRIPRAPAHHGQARPVLRLRVLLGEVHAALLVPRTALLLLAAAGVGWAIQAAHYAVSVVSQQTEPVLWQRVLVAVMIPAGVFAGSSLNQVLLGRSGAAGLFARAYPALPVVCLALAAVVASGPVWASTAVLVAFGVVTGILMPLSPALVVGWHPDLRASVSAAESVAKGLGSTVSPVVLGAVAAATSLGWGLAVVALLTAAGAVCAWLSVRPAREPAGAGAVG